VGDAEQTRIGDELARRLTVGGFEVARPYSIEDWLSPKTIVKRIVYRKARATEGRSTSEVQTTVEEIKVQSNDLAGRDDERTT
jgi:hypothetical protein